MNDIKKTEEKLEDADDLQYLHAARKENEGKPSLTHEEMMKELSLEDAEDIRDLEKAMGEEKDIPGFTVEEAKKALNID